MSGAHFSYKQLMANAFKSLPSRFFLNEVPQTPFILAQEKYLPQVENKM